MQYICNTFVRPDILLRGGGLEKAELVKLRYFVGLTNEQAAEVMGLSAPTATRYWAFARVWLFRAIKRRGEGGGF